MTRCATTAACVSRRRVSIGHALVAVVLVLAAGCLGTGVDEVAVPTPDVATPGLLPPTSPVALLTPGPTATEVPAPATAATGPTNADDPVACLSPRIQIAQLLLPLAEQAQLPAAVDLAAEQQLGVSDSWANPIKG